jgi:ABC-type transporter Mla subunit MlaD
MNKQTKHNRRNRIKNKSKKYYGGKTKVGFQNSRGIFDLVGDKLSGFSEKALEYVADKGLRLVGLQPIKKNEETEETNPDTAKVDEKINQIGDAASGLVSNAQEIGSDIVKVFDKGSAAVIGQINDVLESPKIENSITEAASETAEIGEKLLEKFNDKLSSPELKEEAKEALDNAADYTNIAVEAMDEPVNNAVDQLNEAGTKAASGAVSGIVKVGTDALAAVPGAGAIIEVGKIVNDASKAVGDVVEAATDATSTISKVVGETSENINEGLDELEKRKKEGEKILSRTDESIQSFENPIKTADKAIKDKAKSAIKGGSKTKRKLFKNKAKSKRVRFAI